jgi:hypothetical protein
MPVVFMYWNCQMMVLMWPKQNIFCCGDGWYNHFLHIVIYNRMHTMKIGSRIHWTGGWLGLRAALNVVKNRKDCCLCQKWNPGCPARSPSLYNWGKPAPSYNYWKLIFDFGKYIYTIIGTRIMFNSVCKVLAEACSLCMQLSSWCDRNM